MVQRRATRWILSSYSPYQSVTELQQQLNLRTLEQRRVDARAATIQLPHGTIRITIFASRYDVYRDTFLTTLETT